MTKIEPVSKAAAVTFMQMCVGLTDPSIYTFCCAHKALEAVSFSAFCRAVADQLDPPAPCLEELPLTPYGHDQYTKLFRQCFRAGADKIQQRWMLSHTPENRPCGSFCNDEIDTALKKQGLLGDKENDN